MAVGVAFGGLCVSAGYRLAAPVRPFWVAKRETTAPLQRAAAVMLRAPAGWIVFALWYRPRCTARGRAGNGFEVGPAARQDPRLGHRRRLRLCEHRLPGDDGQADLKNQMRQRKFAV